MGFLGLPDAVYTDLVNQFMTGGIGATVLDEKSPETVDKERAVKIAGRNVSLVIPKFAMGSVGGGSGGGFGPSIGKKQTITHPVVNFNHIVRGKVPADGKEMNATLVAKKKGMLSKEIVGVEWEGGRVASMLNADPELNNMLLRNGVSSLKVEADSKNGCMRIVHQHKIDLVSESSGFLVKESRTWTQGLPSLQVFEAIDRIAGRLKG